MQDPRPIEKRVKALTSVLSREIHYAQARLDRLTYDQKILKLVEQGDISPEIMEAFSISERLLGVGYPNISLSNYDALPPRVLNALRAGGYTTVWHVLGVDYETLLSVENIGPRALSLLAQVLQDAGIELPDNWPEYWKVRS